jgi:hypothetical protein
MTTLPNNEHYLRAIADMDVAKHDYNEGVLRTLGRWDEAAAHRYARDILDEYVAQRDALHVPVPGDPLAEMGPAEAAAHKLVKQQQARVAETWAPILALINEARDRLGMYPTA